MSVDESKLPRVSEYLSRLPEGLRSYPQCRVRAEAFDNIGVRYPALVELAPPGPIQELLARRVPSSSWMPEVVGQAASLMIRDAALGSDEEVFADTYQANLDLFARPILRGLMRLVSPTLVIMGASRRWSIVHEGTTLTPAAIRSLGGRSGTTARLTFPPHLFPPLFLESLAHAFAAALTLSRARNVESRLVEHTEESAEYAVTWKS